MKYFPSSVKISPISEKYLLDKKYYITCWCAGEYHCWLQMNTTLMIGQFVPIVILAILTLTLIEAAGAGTELR